MADKRIVVVTGGSRGIGRAVCLSLSVPGTTIFFNYASDDKAAATTCQMVTNQGAVVVAKKVNVGCQSEVDQFFKTIIKAEGQVDVLVNNAGITKDGLLARMQNHAWDEVMDINLKGAFQCTRAAVKSMIRHKKGRIINITSIAGVCGQAGQVNYAAAKAGIIGFTKAAARELAPRNITVNAVAPGYMETDMTAALPEDSRQAILAQIPLGRAGTPGEAAAVVKFLASRQAAYITGQVLHVNGGMYM